MEQKKSPRKQPGQEKNANPCPLYRKCGGCQLQNMSYPRQLQWKQAQVGESIWTNCAKSFYAARKNFRTSI